MAVLDLFPEGTRGIQHPVSEHRVYSGIVGKTGMKTWLLFFLDYAMPHFMCVSKSKM
jgi:hypothetical protein